MPRVREALLSGTILVVLSAVGCGGGGANSPTGTSGQLGGSQTANIGMAQITYSGKPKPLTTGSSGQVSFYGEAGASFTSLTVYPNPNLASTSLVFDRNIQAGPELYYLPAVQGGTATPISLTGQSASPSCSNAGVIAYLTTSNGADQIVTSYLDGSHSRVVSTVPGQPAISPNGATIVYFNELDSNIYSIPVAGGTPTKIYSGGNAASKPIWSPNGTQIAFSAPDSTNTYEDVYTMAPTGGATTNITPIGFDGVLYPSSWSPNGKEIACTYTAVDGMAQAALISTIGDAPAILTPTGYSDAYPAISPDNLRMAFYRTNAGGAIPGIYESDLFGTSPQLVLADPPSTGDTGPVNTLLWTSFLENEKFVGSGSTLSDAAVSGLLLTQNGNQFASLLVFGAATPSTATLTTESLVNNGGPNIFKLAANTINIISYTNIYNGAETFLPLSGTSAALVTLDGTTGFIDMVAPGEFTKKQPMTTSSGRSALVYSGKFSGIYDGTGKNLAPSGASSLQIDAKTGKLVSFQ